MNIKPIPTKGFITRCGRKIYGQDDYDRHKKIVLIISTIVSYGALLAALTGVL